MVPGSDFCGLQGWGVGIAGPPVSGYLDLLVHSLGVLHAFLVRLDLGLQLLLDGVTTHSHFTKKRLRLRDGQIKKKEHPDETTNGVDNSQKKKRRTQRRHRRHSMGLEMQYTTGEKFYLKKHTSKHRQRRTRKCIKMRLGHLAALVRSRRIG